MDAATTLERVRTLSGPGGPSLGRKRRVSCLVSGNRPFEVLKLQTACALSVGAAAVLVGVGFRTELWVSVAAGALEG